MSKTITYILIGIGALIVIVGAVWFLRTRSTGNFSSILPFVGTGQAPSTKVQYDPPSNFSPVVSSTPTYNPDELPLIQTTTLPNLLTP